MSVMARIHDDRPVLPRIVMMRGHTGARGSEEEHECQGRDAVQRDGTHVAVSYRRPKPSNETSESPSLGVAIGHTYPAQPTFGLPCPTTIFTFGLLLWVRPPVPWSLLVIPVL